MVNEIHTRILVLQSFVFLQQNSCKRETLQSLSYVRVILCTSSLINMIAGLNGKNERFQSARW